RRRTVRPAPAAGDRKRGDSGTDGSQTLFPGGNRIRTIGPAANGKAMGGPPKSILAISDLTLGGSTDRADVPIGNAQQSLLQQRDRWFESGSLQRRVCCENLTSSIRATNARSAESPVRT